MDTSACADGKSVTTALCIYCGVAAPLTDEHVLPYGIGGRDILPRASCSPCAKITGALERRLLRGHWWSYRSRLGIKTRRPGEVPAYRPVQLVRGDDGKVPAQVPTEDYPFIVLFSFDPHSILTGAARSDEPAGNAFLKMVGALPSRVHFEGRVRPLRAWEKIEYPINYESADVVRFLAKVAHSYTIRALGLNACSGYFVPSIVLGATAGALTYVGGRSSDTKFNLDPSTSSLHAISHRVESGYVVVSIQLFRDAGDMMPVYEVVTGLSST
jgi:hypothetical protein